MSCSTCSKWNECDECSTENAERIKYCFDGNIAVISKADLYVYKSSKKAKRFSYYNIIPLFVRKVTNRMFDMIYIGKITINNSNKCICEIRKKQVYFSTSTHSYNFSGIDMRMTDEEFRELFKTGVEKSTYTASSFGFGY